MKKMFFMVMLIMISVITRSQQVQDSTSRINFYTGAVGSGFITNNLNSIDKYGNLRVGVHYKQQIIPKVLFDGRIGLDPMQNNIIFYSAINMGSKNLGVSVGYQPTPVSEIRPTPLSVDGQFQFTAETMPPGGAFGMTLRSYNLKFGFYLRNNNPEYQVAYINQKFSIGFWTNTVDSISSFLGGGTFRIKMPYLYTMVSVTTEYEAVALSIKPKSTSNYRIILDLAYKGDDLYSSLIGGMYFFKVKNITDARFGIGYDFIKHSIGTFFLVGLNYKE